MTAENLFLKGKNGLTNGVNVLNKISALYGHGDYAEETMYAYGNTTSGARSIKVEDINNITGYDVKEDDRYGVKWQYKLVADEETEGQNKVQYSTDNGTTWNDCVDIMDNQIRSLEYYKNGNWGELTEIGESVELEFTDYNYRLTDDYKDLVYIENKMFLLASPCANVSGSGALFGLFGVWTEDWYAGVSKFDFCDSCGGVPYENEVAVRPVVSLRSDIQLAETTSGSGVWNITGTN